MRILDGAYEDFEQRVATADQISGSKQERVSGYILTQAPSEFRTRDIQRALPDISSATIRLVLNELRDGRKIRSEGSGSGARWHGI